MSKIGEFFETKNFPCPAPFFSPDQEGIRHLRSSTNPDPNIPNPTATPFTYRASQPPLCLHGGPTLAAPEGTPSAHHQAVSVTYRTCCSPHHLPRQLSQPAHRQQAPSGHHNSLHRLLPDLCLARPSHLRLWRTAAVVPSRCASWSERTVWLHGQGLHRQRGHRLCCCSRWHWELSSWCCCEDAGDVGRH